MASAVTGRPAGRPSTITTRPLPCDSPAVSHLSTKSHYRRLSGAHLLEEPGRRPSLAVGDVAVAEPSLADRGQLGHQLGSVEVTEEAAQERGSADKGEGALEPAGWRGRRHHDPC